MSVFCVVWVIEIWHIAVLSKPVLWEQVKVAAQFLLDQLDDKEMYVWPLLAVSALLPLILLVAILQLFSKVYRHPVSLHPSTHSILMSAIMLVLGSIARLLMHFVLLRSQRQRQQRQRQRRRRRMQRCLMMRLKRRTTRKRKRWLRWWLQRRRSQVCVLPHSPQHLHCTCKLVNYNMSDLLTITDL